MTGLIGQLSRKKSSSSVEAEPVPRQVDDLALWYDFDDSDSMSTEPHRMSRPSNLFDRVVQCMDKSPGIPQATALLETASTPNDRAPMFAPSAVNAKNALFFNNWRTRLTLRDRRLFIDSAAGETGATFFLVAVPCTSPHGSQMMVEAGKVAPANVSIIVTATDVIFSVVDDGTGGAISAAHGAGVGELMIIRGTIVFGDSMSLHLNGVELGTLPITLSKIDDTNVAWADVRSADDSPLCIGCQGKIASNTASDGYRSFYGYLCEFAAYRRAIDAEENELVERYLEEKWDGAIETQPFTIDGLEFYVDARHRSSFSTTSTTFDSPITYTDGDATAQVASFAPHWNDEPPRINTTSGSASVARRNPPQWREAAINGRPAWEFNTVDATIESLTFYIDDVSAEKYPTGWTGWTGDGMFFFAVVQPYDPPHEQLQAIFNVGAWANLTFGVKVTPTDVLVGIPSEYSSLEFAAFGDHNIGPNPMVVTARVEFSADGVAAAELAVRANGQQFTASHNVAKMEWGVELDSAYYPVMGMQAKTMSEEIRRFKGAIGCMGIINKLPTNAQWDALEQSLAASWGITL